jgi:hypothetical protein
MRILSLTADNASPLDLGLNHLQPFGEHRRPRRALSILSREGALCSPEGTKRHQSNFFEGTVAKRSVQASRDHEFSHQVTNCEYIPDLFRLRPSACQAHRATSAPDAGSEAERKISTYPTSHLQPQTYRNDANKYDKK